MTLFRFDSARISLDKVAIKIMDKMRLDLQTQRMLSREVSNMESLYHPNVLQLYEVLETPSRLYLVLEFAGGGDLHTRISSEGKLSDRDSKIVFAQVLSAVKYMVRLKYIVLYILENTSIVSHNK